MNSKLTHNQQAIVDFLWQEINQNPDTSLAKFKLAARSMVRITNAIRAENRTVLTWELRVLFSLGTMGVDLNAVVDHEQLQAWVQALVILNHAALSRGEKVPGYQGVQETPFWCRPVDWEVGGLE